MTQKILSGALIRDGSLPKSAGDAAFQAFLGDLLSKSSGGIVSGSVSFDNGGGGEFSVNGGSLVLQGPNARLDVNSGTVVDIRGGTVVDIRAGALVSTAVNIISTATADAPEHLTSKSYVDTAIVNAVNGRNWVPAARAVAVGNVALVGAPGNIDGVALDAGDRVLLIAQTAPAENGVYVYDGADLVRADDANTAAEMVSLTIWVAEGAAHADVQYTCTADKGLVLGADPVNFVQTGGAGMMLAGWGVGVTGNTVSVKYTPPLAPSGVVDGVNKVFVSGCDLAAFGEVVEIDGVRVYLTDDYILSRASGLMTITFVDAPPVGSRVRVSGFLA